MPRGINPKGGGPVTITEGIDLRVTKNTQRANGFIERFKALPKEERTRQNRACAAWVARMAKRTIQ